jgi:hypothetical protein
MFPDAAVDPAFAATYNRRWSVFPVLALGTGIGVVGLLVIVLIILLILRLR